MRCRAVIVALVLAAAFTGCDTSDSPPGAPESSSTPQRTSAQSHEPGTTITRRRAEAWTRARSGTVELVSHIVAGKPLTAPVGIRLYVNNRFDHRVGPGGQSCNVCPSGTGISCPVSVAGVLKRTAHQPKCLARLPDLVCADEGPRLRLPGLVPVTVVPRQPGACAGDGGQWAIQWWWTPRGALRAVNLVPGEP